MEWLIALAVFLALMAILPAMLRRMRSTQRKADVGGVVLALGLAFAAIFDPGKSAAVEETRRKQELEDEDESGAPPLRRRGAGASL